MVGVRAITTHTHATAYALAHSHPTQHSPAPSPPPSPPSMPPSAPSVPLLSIPGIDYLYEAPPPPQSPHRWGWHPPIDPRPSNSSGPRCNERGEEQRKVSFLKLILVYFITDGNKPACLHSLPCQSHRNYQLPTVHSNCSYSPPVSRLSLPEVNSSLPPSAKHIPVTAAVWSLITWEHDRRTRSQRRT